MTISSERAGHLARIGALMYDPALALAEHVRAGSPRLARWQDRLAGPWAALAQGCRCNAATEMLLERELRLERVERVRWRGMPALVHPLIVGEGVA
jgi:hypothetical protein